MHGDSVKESLRIRADQVESWKLDFLRALGNKKLLGTSASLVVTSALLVVTRSYYFVSFREKFNEGHCFHMFSFLPD